MVGIQLDIAKAFDTIPQLAIAHALQRLGVPGSLCSAIVNGYEGLKTSIKCGDSKIDIQLKRGVKQSDPLSPYIFNSIIDPLIQQLEAKRGIEINETYSISCLAFADDIILLAKNE
jgi:hypothetical protein